MVKVKTQSLGFMSHQTDRDNGKRIIVQEWSNIAVNEYSLKIVPEIPITHSPGK